MTLHDTHHSLSAGLLRQATYTTARLGMYSIINDWLVARNNGNAAIPFYQVRLLNNIINIFLRTYKLYI
jgi:hypothetical protein